MWSAKVYGAALLVCIAFYIAARGAVTRRQWLSLPARERLLYLAIVFLFLSAVITMGFHMDWIKFRFGPPYSRGY